ncbi:Fungal fucose-specific lectin [Moelleriella libera RCEF 2490]|uniref:Fungal fucose-specific lectin n=1 Tax=Moelleriella libera RCEF 2490 TaxID=1081109 RepID=A0A166RKH0_9HYPO|nr:Fungal fucose-specific lectin [Moelleriella libera RCEF 2490]
MINQASGLPSTTFHRKNGQLVIYVFLQDTSGYIRKIRWDQHGWSKNTEPPLVQAKSGASFSVVGWSDDDSEDHVRIYYFDTHGTFSEYCIDNGRGQKGSDLPQ